jgi:hypothetical protein
MECKKHSWYAADCYPVIPLFHGRPDRNEEISKDDITNLRIDLGRSNTVEGFLELIS